MSRGEGLEMSSACAPLGGHASHASTIFTPGSLGTASAFSNGMMGKRARHRRRKERALPVLLSKLDLVVVQSPSIRLPRMSVHRPQAGQRKAGLTLRCLFETLGTHTNGRIWSPKQLLRTSLLEYL